MLDELHKFLFEACRCAACWCGSGLVARAAGRRVGATAYPPPVRTLLGEMAAAAALMQANIKFDGAVILQVFGDGPVKLAVAEVQPDLGFRATAKVVAK